MAWAGNFELEVPNGDYYVTLCGGNPNWGSRFYLEVEGTVYGGTNNNENLYLANIIPDGIPLPPPYTPGVYYSDGYVKTPDNWYMDQDFTKHAPLQGGTFDQITTWSGTVDNPDPNQRVMEVLYLQNQLVTVSDGKLTVKGAADNVDVINRIQFVEITGEGIPTAPTVPSTGLKFDFGWHDAVNAYGVPITAAPGYIFVDNTMLYGEQQIDGLDYGFTDVDAPKARDGWATRHSPTTLTLTEVDVALYTGSFDLEVPNGDYYVTLFAGNVGWDFIGYLQVEGTIYGGTNNNENLYIVDVAPDRALIASYPPRTYPDGYITWTQDQDFTKHAPLSGGTLDQITTWGGNHQVMGPFGVEYSHYMEALYLENQLVTVSDGKLTIEGAQHFLDGVRRMGFVEIRPATCLATIEAGYGLKEDLNEDCQIDLADFAQLAAKWLMCNTPGEPDCLQNWP